MNFPQKKSSRRIRGAHAARSRNRADISQSAVLDVARIEPDQAAGPATERALRIAMAAYFIAERRGFAPGHELDDWLAAEAEVDGSALPSVMTNIEIGTNGRAS